ncbi:hypothetical protein GUJ93_ZPchr0005g14333 [Zizania palustris]|uniref:Hexosyltransferase n=1 Tax=Zizania palustris TaxID=103762 RepID=A0A8J5VI30_ZIZPA|nr:hypothetical protein GUJ93_ZPchr0005g14333 [Zizania palustris]
MSCFHLNTEYVSSFCSDDMTKRRTPKSKSFKDVENFGVLVLEKNCSCKFKTLRYLLLAITSATFLTLLTPTLYEHQLQSSSRYVDVGWIWDKPSYDPRYVSSVKFQWEDVYGALLLPESDVSVVRLEHAKDSITWETLYPEWIDEEEESDIPSCPSLPDPNVRKGVHFDVIAVKLPCTQVGGWSRDVARLHLQLSAAKLAVTSSKAHWKVHVLFVTECFPIPNLFPCKNLVKHEGNAWLYRPDLKALREKVRLPVGSCELAVPLKAKARLYSVDRRREAYATILHSASEYVCGAIAAAQSIRQAGSSRDLLTDYDKIIFIDADLLILRNVDFLFAMPEITATGNNATLFNSGVMVIEPSNCTFQLLMDHINEITSYNGGDQGYLNEIFTWWHRIPKHMNFLKHFWEGDSESVKAKKTELFGADPPILYVLHYLGLKPWLCFRDYDCNWNNPVMRDFASDVAHARWWKVHDKMPKKLQSYCVLRSRLKAGLEWDRRQAEKANFEDGHWRRNITDPRLKICYEKFCFWESMLWHWGEKNWTSSNPVPAMPSVRLLRTGLPNTNTETHPPAVMAAVLSRFVDG